MLFLIGSATTANQAMIYRFLLGFFEGATLPALMTMIANWFPNEERARATSAFLASASISQITIGPMASMILAGHSWRNLFHFSAILSAILIVIWLVFLVELPIDAKWLSEEERNYIHEKLEAKKEDKKTVVKAPFIEVLKEINMWKLYFMYFSLSLGTLGFAFWLPTMIKNIVKTGMTQTGFLSMTPNLLVLIGILLMGVISDKTQKRKLLAGFTPVIFSGLLVLAMLLKENVWLSFSIICFSGLFLQGSSPNLWAMVPQLLPSEKAGTASGLLNASSNVGGSENYPHYRRAI